MRKPKFTHPFATPIPLKRGPADEFVTLRDAAELIGRLHVRRQARPPWQYAAELSLRAATTGKKADIDEARLQMLRALHTEGSLCL